MRMHHRRYGPLPDEGIAVEESGRSGKCVAWGVLPQTMMASASTVRTPTATRCAFRTALASAASSRGRTRRVLSQP
jgi:hypothetical protein